METPLNPFERQLLIAEILSNTDPINYFRSGGGASWLLAIAQGIQITQEFCLANEEKLFEHESNHPK